MDKNSDKGEPWDEAHRLANDAGENFYIDPLSGRFVMTEYYLRGRGYCCGSGCRHCPYEGDEKKSPE